MEWVLLILLLLSLAIQVGYLISLKDVPLKSQNDDSKPNQDTANEVSVIICAQNEADNLKRYLPLVLKQNFNRFEVIVVDDNSKDDTQHILCAFAKQYTNLSVIRMGEGEKKLNGKKELIAKALAASHFETIVVTDADCYPATLHWLEALNRFNTSTANVVIGYSPFEITECLLNKLIRFDATQAAWQYFSAALKGKAYMGVGRNMLFRKQDYLKWYHSREHTMAGGDDDLFVNWLVNENKGLVAICAEEESFVYTIPKKSYVNWLHQKSRHVMASFHYSRSDKIILFVFAISQFTFYSAAILLISTNAAGRGSSIFLLLVLYVFYYLRSRAVFSKLKQTDLLMWIPLLHPLYVISISLIFLLSLIKRSDTWK